MVAANTADVERSQVAGRWFRCAAAGGIRQVAVDPRDCPVRVGDAIGDTGSERDGAADGRVALAGAVRCNAGRCQ